jgi:F-type H+-transporting ATPase subunit c
VKKGENTKMKNVSTKLVTIAAIMMAALPVLAQEAEKLNPAASVSTTGWGLRALGAGLAIGVAALGGAFGQGRATAQALDGIARNPAASGKILVPMIIGLALIESLVIYALVIALNLAG